MQQPRFTDPAYKVWIRDHYPQEIARLNAIARDHPREVYDTDNRAELAERKREIANVCISNAVRLLKEATAIETEINAEVGL